MRYLVWCTCAAIATLSLGVQPSVPAAPATGSIERMATLATGRAAHTTTVLPSGDLLVAGGMGPGGGSLATTELIHVSAGTIGATASMSQPRASHTATALGDGRVVLAGGYNGEYLSSVEVFDERLRRFRIMGRLNEGRSGHTATLLPDGRILIVGGVGRGWSFLSSAEVFDPASGRSETVGPMSVPRESHTATLLADGRVLVVGGHRDRREAMEVYASAELYDPASRRFQPTAHLTTARHKHDAVRLSDGRVLVLGGADRTDRRYFATTEIFNPATGSFGRGPAMVSSRYKFQGTSVRLANGDVLVAAGARGAELLDRDSLTFHPVAGDFPAALFFATATPLSTGDVVIVGGYSTDNQSAKGVWRFRAR